MESESYLVEESYSGKNHDLSNFIWRKPIAIFIESKDCTICQQMHRKAFTSKEIYKALSDWHVIQIDSEESN